ncbi:MAG: ribulose-phosphate 3-epimerase [Firmicutes bacterium]|nr:ribulose-phosphate 3-epimerase [Bacillota bacterium]
MMKPKFKKKEAVIMAKIAPSILSADFMNLERDIRAIEKNGGDYVHIDVMDGNFVPNITFGVPVVKAVRPVTSLPLDVHLMIDRPIRYVDAFCNAGADYLTLHIEADTQENTISALKRIAALGKAPAISLKPGTPAEAAIPYFPYCSMILVMTVEPGFGGQKFMADMMPKLRRLRSLLTEGGFDCLLEVDGGVDSTTASQCKESGADILVTGSAYFKAPDKPEFVKMIQS